MDQFLQPKEFMEKRTRNAGAKQHQQHHAIDQKFDLCHPPFAISQTLFYAPVTLVTDRNVDGQVLFSIAHVFWINANA